MRRVPAEVSRRATQPRAGTLCSAPAREAVGREVVACKALAREAPSRGAWAPQSPTRQPSPRDRSRAA